MPILRAAQQTFETHIPVIVVGAGACGLTAALAVRDAGVEVLVLERDSTPLGTTAMSTGLIPAAGTLEQQARDIDDDPPRFRADVMRKARNGANAAVVKVLTEESAETVSWLRDQHGIPLTLLDGFVYPGHSVMRMYGTPHRMGGELIAALQAAAGEAGADILTQALVRNLYVDDAQHICGVSVERPDGAVEIIGCDVLILACCGFAGNPELVRKYIPEIADGVFHGHPGNKGEAIAWATELGARLVDMDAYQGHGGLAAGHGIPILWPLIMEGGFQVNSQGERFSDESKGYSEQAVNVLAQPGGTAFSVFDERLHQLMQQFNDYDDALDAGAILKAGSVEELAAAMKVPARALEDTFAQERSCKEGKGECPFGRNFRGKAPLSAPFYAARVTGALFHTQGGLEVDESARVIRENGEPFANLFAGGGAARGISGSGASGYIAGNGLLTATGLGKIAGRTAAAQLIAAASAS
jgi:fumarate reductase flavoprotein subunit